MSPYYYSYNYGSSSSGNDAVFIVFTILFLLIGIASYVITGIFLSKIFKKLGTTPEWSAWVPFYGQWKFYEAGGQFGWWMFVPGANAAFAVMAAYNIGLRFGKSDNWVLFFIFLAPVWLIILGLDDAKLVSNPRPGLSLNGAAPAQSKKK